MNQVYWKSKLFARLLDEEKLGDHAESTLINAEKAGILTLRFQQSGQCVRLVVGSLVGVDLPLTALGLVQKKGQRLTNHSAPLHSSQLFPSVAQPGSLNSFSFAGPFCASCANGQHAVHVSEPLPPEIATRIGRSSPCWPVRTVDLLEEGRENFIH